MTQIIIAPSRYVQGRGAINDIGEHAGIFGKKVLVVGGNTGLASTRQGREESFAKHGITQVEELFGGECSDAEIARLSEIARSQECDVAMASGGGKTIDTVKVVAANVNAATVIVPTTASTDAPCSALSVVYSDEGVFDKFFVPPRNPDLVLVDTQIVANGPARLLVAGMGDALATWFEADAAARSCALNLPGGQMTQAALTLARLCYDILMECGLQAKIAVEESVVTPALEKVVEANTLLSGVGFESGGLAAAHSMQDGFTLLEEIHDFLHGEKVAFLTLVQLVMEARPKEVIRKVFDFCIKVGLPVCLEDLNIHKAGPKRLMEAVEESCLPGKIMFNHAFPITAEFVYDAMISADAMGRRVKAGQPIV
ncbi:MAG: glycerol dehydrogenase [Deltaproteobacteria bacterium]|nr:glycerol dehydrogenase [Deltaproteobacteria bacterium]